MVHWVTNESASESDELAHSNDMIKKWLRKKMSCPQIMHASRTPGSSISRELKLSSTETKIENIQQLHYNLHKPRET